MLFNIILWALVFYFIFSMQSVKKRQRKNQKLISVISSVRHPGEFYENADNLIEEMHGLDLEFENKTKIVKLWGMTYNRNYFKFEEVLEDISLWSLVRQGKGHHDISANEDSFFYFLLATPNMLAADGQKELREAVDSKLQEMDGILNNHLIVELYKQFNKFYDYVDDKGQAFYESVLAGEYGDYFYSKSLIGLYKDLVSTMLAQIYVDQNDMEKYEAVKPDVERFMRSGVGERWVRNLNLPVTLPQLDENGNPVEETPVEDAVEEEQKDEETGE